MADTEFRSVYVHVPFCARRCPYCDFAIEVRRRPSLEDWTRAVAAEWRQHLEDPRVQVAEPLDSLYVGGGTPSTLGPELASAIGRWLGPTRLPGAGGEWTVEVNPESFDRETAQAWRSAGVTRVSIGVQSFHEPALRWMARLHGPEGASRAVEIADAAGFDHVSVDLIFGLPAHLGRSWTSDLDRTIGLGVPHVSLYGLTVEDETPLARAIAAGREPGTDEATYEAEYLEAAERLTAAGYEHYEVSSFARPGHRALHNPVYWSRRPYLGVGNGAHSYAPPRRWWNVRDWGSYRGLVLSGRSPVEDTEIVTGEASALERIWLALRTAEGLDPGAITGGPPGSEAAQLLIGDWVERGWARRAHAGRGPIRLTPHGWLLLDHLATELADRVGAPPEGLEDDRSPP